LFTKLSYQQFSSKVLYGYIHEFADVTLSMK